MKKETAIVLGLVATAVIGTITYLVIDNKKKNLRLDKLEEDNLKLLQSNLIDRTNISDEVCSQIKELIVRYQNEFPDIAKELETALKVYSTVNSEKSIGSISICIENLLEMKFKSNREFKTWIKTEKNKNPKSATQEDYVEFAHKENIFSKEEFEFTSLIRKVRNKTFHKAGYELTERFGEAYMLLGIGITFRLGDSLLKMKELPSPSQIVK